MNDLHFQNNHRNLGIVYLHILEDNGNAVFTSYVYALVRCRPRGGGGLQNDTLSVGAGGGG